MEIIRIIPITDEDANKSKFLFANYVPNKNEVIYEIKQKKGRPRNGTSFCKLQEFLTLPEIDSKAKVYISKFKKENNINWIERNFNGKNNS